MDMRNLLAVYCQNAGGSTPMLHQIIFYTFCILNIPAPVIFNYTDFENKRLFIPAVWHGGVK